MWWLWWVLLFILLLLLCIFGLRKYLDGDKFYWSKKNVYFLELGKLASFLDRMMFRIPIHEMQQRIYREFKKSGNYKYGGIMEMRNPALYVMDPDLIKHIMVKDFDVFVNRRELINFEKSDPLFHKMLLMSRDQEWKDLRSKVSPTFTTGKIRRMFEVFNTSSNKLAKFLTEQTKDGKNEIDLRPIFTRYTMDVIASAAFGLDSESFGEAESEFCQMAKRMQKFSIFRILKIIFIISFPKLAFLRIPLADLKSTNFFADVTKKTIKHREETGEVRDDFLQLLIEARSDQETKLDEKQNDEEVQIVTKSKKMKLTENHILAQSLLFFFAGFDTVETLLLFAAYELAINPEIQETLFEELSEAYEKNGKKLNYDMVMNLSYLDKVISETLRKYPPAFRTERISSRSYEVPNSNLVIEKETTVVVPVYSIHHDEEYYPNPTRFDPERFSAEIKLARNPYTYMPFGVGPRNCVAMRFALAEGKAAVAHLILNFQLGPTSRLPIPMKFSNSAEFKPQSGVLWLSINPRDNRVS